MMSQQEEKPKPKKKFEKLSTNEWLGDSVTHFMKSGDTLRSGANAGQQLLASYIPQVANGVKVEYDISFDIPGRIMGYKFSDFLSSAVYIAPNSFHISVKNIAEQIARGPTEEGTRVVNAIRETMEDKYILVKDYDWTEIDNLIILPGTNILVNDGAVDTDKIDALVEAGAHVKLHPITSKIWQTMLTKRWGAAVIPADAPLYPALRAAKKIYFTMSSETGFAATILKKPIGIIDGKDKKPSNFEFIYRGMDVCKVKMPLIDKMSAIFSYPETGVFSIHQNNPKERIEQFFAHMKATYPHGK